MNNKKKYIILHEDGIYSLQNEVNEKINEGYEPYGSMAIYPKGSEHISSILFCQPMLFKNE